MTGNVSKAKGFKGEKGDTPAIVFEYDESTGNLYYSSDGIMVDKDYVASQNLVTKEEVETALDNIIAIQESLIGGDTA